MPGASVHAIKASKLLSHFSPRYGWLGYGKFVLDVRRKSSNRERLEALGALSIPSGKKVLEYRTGTAQHKA